MKKKTLTFDPGGLFNIGILCCSTRTGSCYEDNPCTLTDRERNGCKYQLDIADSNSVSISSTTQSVPLQTLMKKDQVDAYKGNSPDQSSY